MGVPAEVTPVAPSGEQYDPAWTICAAGVVGAGAGAAVVGGAVVGGAVVGGTVVDVVSLAMVVVVARAAVVLGELEPEEEQAASSRPPAMTIANDRPTRLIQFLSVVLDETLRRGSFARLARVLIN